MQYQSLIGAIALATALLMTNSDVQAFDEAHYPNLKGQWRRVEPGNPVRFDPTRPPGLGQQAPLTAEYQALFEAGLADMAAGGPGLDPSYVCIAPGMPRIMNVYTPMEIVVTPETTYILISHNDDSYRRIYTDGRDWPTNAAPTFAGYSIGKWIDEDGDGIYDVLEVETRVLKGPRGYDTSGLPFHSDNQTIIKERIYLDKADRNTLIDDMTVIDNALTRPYTKKQTATRNPNPRPVWHSDVCSEFNTHVRIGTENYYLSADGKLMPAKKNQAPPDLSYFKQSQ